MSDRPTSQPPHHAPAAADGGGDPWQVVSDAVLRGLSHELSNRAAALSGLTGMLQPDAPPGREVAELLAREAARLEETLRLSRLLPRARPARPSSCSWPTRWPPRGLLHAFTLLLGALALHARSAAASGSAGAGPVLRVAGGVDVVRLAGQSAHAAAAESLAPAAVAASATRVLEGAGTVTPIERAGVVRYAMELRALGGAAGATG